MSDAFAPLYIAYSIAWIGVVAYLVLLHMRQKRLAAEVAALKEGGNG
jgi:CcmD family protein